MKYDTNYIKQRLKTAGLKVTPQRIAVLNTLFSLNNHPTAESIIEHVHYNHPGIAIATVYNILDILVERKIIVKVKTAKDIMRYDAGVHPHHHLYCTRTDQILDYEDTDLDKMIRRHFKKKKIEGFEIEDIKLQIKGKTIK